MHTPSEHTRPVLQSFDRVHGAFGPPEGESAPPHPGSRESPNALPPHAVAIKAKVTALRTTTAVYLAHAPRASVRAGVRYRGATMTDPLSALVEDGESLLFDGDYAGARRVFEQAVAEAKRTHGERAKELIVPLMGLARAAGENNAAACDAMEAELEAQRRALEIAEDALPSDDLLLAECLHAHGVSVWASGEPTRAVELLLRALGVVRSARSDAHGYLGPLVGALLDAQRTHEALPHARELLDLEDASSPPDLTTLFLVGQCFRQAGANEDARAVFQRFLVAFGEDGNATIRDEVKTYLEALDAAPS